VAGSERFEREEDGEKTYERENGSKREKSIYRQEKIKKKNRPRTGALPGNCRKRPENRNRGKGGSGGGLEGGPSQGKNTSG